MLPRLIALNLVGKRWPRTDERHLAAQDVEQLRQLVERGATEEAADAGDPRVATQLECAVIRRDRGRLDPATIMFVTNRRCASSLAP